MRQPLENKVIAVGNLKLGMFRRKKCSCPIAQKHIRALTAKAAHIRRSCPPTVGLGEQRVRMARTPLLAHRALSIAGD